MEIKVFWDVTICQRVNNYGRFEGTCCLVSASPRRLFDLENYNTRDFETRGDYVPIDTHNILEHLSFGHPNFTFKF